MLRHKLLHADGHHGKENGNVSNNWHCSYIDHNFRRRLGPQAVNSATQPAPDFVSSSKKESSLARLSINAAVHPRTAVSTRSFQFRKKKASFQEFKIMILTKLDKVSSESPQLGSAVRLLGRQLDVAKQPTRLGAKSAGKRRARGEPHTRWHHCAENLAGS